MRTIKFRGQRYNYSWVYGDLLEKPNCYPVIRAYYDLQDVNDNVVISETIGQFTGLYDKNGKEIYEGDICRIEDCAIWTVEWNNEQACFSFREENRCLGSASISIFRYLTEIIGNIHDNPELLKGGNP